MYEISDDPIDGLKRKVSWAGLMLAWEPPVGEYVGLYLNVRSFLDDKELVGVPTKLVPLLATKDTMIDEDGFPASPDLKDGEGNALSLQGKPLVISEFDYFRNMVNGPVHIPAFIKPKIDFADSAQGGKRFD
jgi:hypothetical protein